MGVGVGSGGSGVSGITTTVGVSWTGVAVGGFGVGVLVGSGVPVGVDVSVCVGSGVEVFVGAGVSVGWAAGAATVVADTTVTISGIGTPAQAVSWTVGNIRMIESRFTLSHLLSGQAVQQPLWAFHCDFSIKAICYKRWRWHFEAACSRMSPSSRFLPPVYHDHPRAQTAAHQVVTVQPRAVREAPASTKVTEV